MLIIYTSLCGVKSINANFLHSNDPEEQTLTFLVISDWLIILSCMSHSIMGTKSEPQSRIKTSKQFQYTDIGGTKCLLNPFLIQHTEPVDWLTTVFRCTVWLIHINPTWQQETLQNQYLWLIAVQPVVPELILPENDHQQFQNHLVICHDGAPAQIILLVTVKVSFFSTRKKL